MDGDHDIERHAEVTEAVQRAVFDALRRHHVTLELMILKPDMVLPGKDCPAGLAWQGRQCCDCTAGLAETRASQSSCHAG